MPGNARSYMGLDLLPAIQRRIRPTCSLKPVCLNMCFPTPNTWICLQTCLCRDLYTFINGLIGIYVVGIATSSLTNPDRGSDVKGLGRIRNMAINRRC